ncbi:MAG: OmpA family protein [Smithella sp.]|jgi:chemotaxis protein MotB|nr:OmpA family protein [Smithella sp.]
MEERHQQIIIKKVKKKSSGGAHGGSWKVAYADFVTAMMAFFLLLWLLSMVSEEKRAALSEYFRHYSIFQETGSSAITSKDARTTDPHFLSETGTPTMKTPAGSMRGKGYIEYGAKKPKKNITVEDEEPVKKILAAIDDKMAGVRDQVLVDVIEDGIRIQVIDTEGFMMFPSGSSVPTQKAREVLKLVADNIKDIPGKIVVEGHTDSAPFKKEQITNWELSTDRASAARRLLEEFGTDPARIGRVVGYADQEPLLPLDPFDHRNRRISIIVLQTKDI